MKLLFILLFLSSLLPSLLLGTSLQFRTGYFYPASKLLQEIYHNGGLEYEVEGQVTLYQKLCAFVNFNYFGKEGESIPLYDKTSIQLLPLSAGLKCSFQINRSWNFYLGLGPSFTWIKIRNHSPFVRSHLSETAWGVVSKTGFLYFFGKSGFVDVFADYSYTKVKPLKSHHSTTHSLDAGGLRAGVGLGIHF